MRRVLALALLLAAPTFGCATPLDGTWRVDLSTKPDTPYTQPMQLTLNADGTVTGRFYQSTIDAGRWKESRGRLCASFRTTDGVGPYHTAVCLTGDTATGQTWAERRGFLFNWTATREAAAEVAPSP